MKMTRLGLFRLNFYAFLICMAIQDIGVIIYDEKLVITPTKNRFSETTDICYVLQEFQP